ncbi:short-chain-enoyl-CoA hydratase [Clostridium sp. D2Q-11]|uniref:Short-chain-enoyl-CoA hydratase n=1 Tax=Anaeromonas frigoriresistens TaxID=2683708 RepID=A0A942UXV5_9FIRM|nr:short-chain-enoyl-CoA hydratase [Anaeromonas frigoriresistens]
MEFNSLTLQKEDKIAILKINRPKALNALNTEVLLELDKAIEELKSDQDVNVIILSGEGKAFVAGADILEMKEKTANEARDFAKVGIELFRKIEMIEKPVIAAVNGFALGGGCELSMACDMRIASEKAKFGQPEVGLGITPGFAGTQRLPRLVGSAKAKELIFTGDVIDAKEAERIGLVNKVVNPEELMDETMKLAKKISSKAQLAVRYSKMAINRGIETDVETGMEIEKDLFALCFATEDQTEGMTAFSEKRKPDFKNK